MLAAHDPVNLTIFWAKLADSGEAAGYHPLICHLLDVAAVAETLWDSVLSEAARRGIAASLGFGDDLHMARTWVAFLAGCHDLGKCSPSFSFKPAAIRLHSLYDTMDGDCQRRRPDGPIELPAGTAELPHGVITAATLPAILCGNFGLSPRDAAFLSRITGGHHGTFELNPGRHVKGGPSIGVGRGRWPDARARLTMLLAVTLGVPRNRPPVRPDAGVALALAGYISVADWIGSNDDPVEGFPYEQDIFAPVENFDAEAYLHKSRERAVRALAWTGWTGWRQPDKPAEFRDLFPFEANALQLAVAELAEQITGEGEPGLVIVEAPMGEGKTEAALYLADRWGIAPGPRGIYFGLPTMATSNQIFGRLQDFLAKRYPDDAVNVQLLHGRANLLDEVQVLRGKARDLFVPEEVYGEDARSGIGAAGWFAAPKRGLLAPFAAGTVDQLLMTVLKTRHVFVRLFGVHRKTVIVDEVHAYDAYMSTLLEAVLSWLAVLGSPVILLSATLPADRRNRLLEAYWRGLGSLKREPPPEVSYPRLTWTNAAGSGSRGIDGASVSQKQLFLRLIDDAMRRDDGTYRLAGLLQDRLRDGGCVAVVCNTVGRAQTVYEALRGQFPDERGEPIVRLFHARYRFLDRSAREQWALAAFGKPGSAVAGPNGESIPVSRPRRAILVATQVIEQSLDLDFDLMVTDFAPADLLLQRSGRLQRHERGARLGFEPPELWLIGPEAYNGSVPRFDRGSCYVYAPYVLLRTWLSLHARGLLGAAGGAIAVPDDVEGLIEDTYAAAPYSVPDSTWEAILAGSKQNLDEAVLHEQREAKARWTPRPNACLVDWLEKMTSNSVEEDRPEIHERLQALTRLPPPGVTLVLLRPDEQAEAARLTANWREARAVYSRYRRTPPGPSVEQRLESSRLDASRREARRQLERFMLERAIDVTRYDVVRYWRMQPVPELWSNSPTLSHAWRIDLDESGGALRFTGGGPILTLDSDLGLVVTAVLP